nr:type II secretion system protein GspG [Mucilaginibacter sp. L294]
MNNTFKSLISTTGKVIFAIGLVLNICMVFFGVWPSLIYLLLMLFGAAIVSFIGKDDIIGLNFSSIKNLLIVVTITCISIITLTIGISFFSKNYFNKTNTLSECKEIVIALNQYKENTTNYPANLSILIAGNPLRADWTKDQWGNPYKYIWNNNGSSYTLTSAGSDNKFNTKDDLTFIGKQ